MNEHYAKFPQHELASPDTGDHYMNVETMDLIMLLRLDYWGKPMIPSSAYRTPDHNEKVSTTGRNGPHTTGNAMDIVICGAAAFEFLEAVCRLNRTTKRNDGARYFTGIGISQKGPHKSRFIHLDTLRDSETAGPRPWIWSYIFLLTCAYSTHFPLFL